MVGYALVMGYSIGYDDYWRRDIGYGVPAICDHPDCNQEINRGLANVCGGYPYGGEHGCGLFFCSSHLFIIDVGDEYVQLCDRCIEGRHPFDPKPDVAKWVFWKLKENSWHKWRLENPDKVREYRRQLKSNCFT